jgi:hypothetical protein
MLKCPKCNQLTLSELVDRTIVLADPLEAPTDGIKGRRIGTWYVIAAATAATGNWRGMAARIVDGSGEAVTKCSNPECLHEERRLPKERRHTCGVSYPEYFWHTPSGCPGCSRSFVD